MKRDYLFLLVVFLNLVFAGCQKNDQIQVQDNTSSLKSASIQGIYDMVPNEVLVKFKDGVDASKKASILDKFGGRLKEKILTKMMEKVGDKEGISLITVKGNSLDAIAKAKGLPEIEYAEPNYIYTHEVVSNDPYFTNGSLWGMNGTFGCQAQVAWGNNHTGISAVYVGIIDEGFMYTHEDLAPNAGNRNEIAGNKKDDDGNGFVDDTYGWNFVANNNIVFEGVSDDHGTHVAGTIDGVGGNGKGVAGVCWNVRLIDAKFLGTTGGTTANAVKAVDYFTNLKATTHINLVATNNSWGGGGFSQSLYDAISRANAADILFIAAAGNSGTNNDVTASYPSNYELPNVIAVAAITKTGALATFSQYGLTTVDIGAPGDAIYSTVPKKSGNKIISAYASYSGTSMATPHVTGAAALYASTHSGASAAVIKKAILDAAVATPSLNGKCVTGGRLNVIGF